MIDVVCVNSSIERAGQDKILLRIHDNFIKLVSQFKHFVALYLFLFAFLGQLETDYIALSMEIPSCRPASKSNHCCVNDKIIWFGIRLEVIREEILLFCELFQVDQLNSVIGREADKLIDRLVKVGLSTGLSVFICLQLFSCFHVP